MDIKVDAAVIFGLSETAENLLQEGGRPMRGSSQETGGKQGYAFFFHKGNLGKVNQKHFVGSEKQVVSIVLRLRAQSITDV